MQIFDDCSSWLYSKHPMSIPVLRRFVEAKRALGTGKTASVQGFAVPADPVKLESGQYNRVRLQAYPMVPRDDFHIELLFDNDKLPTPFSFITATGRIELHASRGRRILPVLVEGFEEISLPEFAGVSRPDISPSEFNAYFLKDWYLEETTKKAIALSLTSSPWFAFEDSYAAGGIGAALISDPVSYMDPRQLKDLNEYMKLYIPNWLLEIHTAEDFLPRRKRRDLDGVVRLPFSVQIGAVPRRPIDTLWGDLHAHLSRNRVGEQRELSYIIGTDIEMDFYNSRSEATPIVTGRELAYDGDIHVDLLELHTQRGKQWEMVRLISRYLLYLHTYTPVETKQSQKRLEKASNEMLDEITSWEIETAGHKVFELGSTGFLLNVKRLAKSFTRLNERTIVDPRDVALAVEKWSDDHARLYSLRLDTISAGFLRDTPLMKTMAKTLTIVREIGEASREAIMLEATKEGLDPDLVQQSLDELCNAGFIYSPREGWYLPV